MLKGTRSHYLAFQDIDSGQEATDTPSCQHPAARCSEAGKATLDMSGADYTQIRYHVDGAVAIVSLWRPEVVNGELYSNELAVCCLRRHARQLCSTAG